MLTRWKRHRGGEERGGETAQHNLELSDVMYVDESAGPNGLMLDY